VLLKGLKTLEYRGYDSAGVAILDNGIFKRVRAEGKLVALENKLVNETFSGNIGIGHTRWATHGPPNEVNAHPHSSKGITLVHNGIIENFVDLKEEVLASGKAISSDTDTEIVAHLISIELDKGLSLLQSVQSVLPRLHGAFSILVVSENEPNTMVAFKNGPPLLLGKESDGSVVVGSDVQAIIPYTSEVIYLEDNEIALVDKNRLSFYLPSGVSIEKKSVNIEWTPEQSEKQGFSHFMLKEIFEQPRALAQCIDSHINLENKTVKLRGVGFSENHFDNLDSLNIEADYQVTNEVFKSIEKIVIVACGTSYYAGAVGKYLIEEFCRVPVEIDVASEFRYRNPIITENNLVITISQSGETADTLAALRLAKDQGAKILSICNVKRSSIDREADGHLYMNAGVEIGVASTKAFTCTQGIMLLLAAQIAKSKNLLSLELEKEIVENLMMVPSQMEVVLTHDKFFAEASENLKKYKGFLYMARGINFPIALEGALKLKELAYMHAEGYAAGEMKHGPLALIDDRMAVIMIAPNDSLYEKTMSNLEEAKARGGQIISIGSESNQRLKQISINFLSIPNVKWYINPILSVVPLQLLAFHVADVMGYDVDQPRNLAKSVTVE
jgi:glucosamine--fructose-6-phosphate aminotransferase (isomerizing)